MYRWFQHRGANSTRPSPDVELDVCATSDQTPHATSLVDPQKLISKGHEFRPRRRIVLTFLSLFVISSFAGWQLPSPPKQEKELAAITSAANSLAPGIRTTRSNVKHGFTLGADANHNPPVKWSLLNAESESEVKALISILNEAIVLPAEVEFSFEDCKDSDVYYDEQRNRVVICRQWLSEMERVLSRSSSDKALVRQTVQSVAAAVFLHETAHALIDVLDLPVTGREEDAADQFSTLVLLHQKDGLRKVLQVAQTYKALSQDTARYPPVYWGEHSLNIQRYYDTLCMVYGRDPKQNSTSLNSDLLPAARAEICESEYQRIESSWKKLLKPHANNSLWQAR